MKLYLAHNDPSFEKALKEFIQTEVPDVHFYAYDESYTDERQKANKVKGGFSAKMSPFAVIKTDDERFVKAFYSEVEECTIDNITHNLLFYYGSSCN